MANPLKSSTPEKPTSMAEYLMNLNNTRTRPNVEWTIDHAGNTRINFIGTDFDRWMEYISKTSPRQDEIDEVPDQWRRIAVERGFLIRSFDANSQYARYTWRVPFEQRRAA